MTIVATNAAAKTYLALRDGTRRWAGDVDRTRFDDIDVNEALNQSFAEVHEEMGLNATTVEAYVDIAYPSDAEFVTLTDALRGVTTRRAESINNAYPVRMIYVSPIDIEKFRRASDEVVLEAGTRAFLHRWTIQDDKLLVRPRSQLTVRLHYVHPPWVVGSDGDQHPYPVEFEEFIQKSAAKRLLSIDDQVPIALMQDVIGLGERMKRYAQRKRGPRRVRRVNPYVF